RAITQLPAQNSAVNVSSAYAAVTFGRAAPINSEGKRIATLQFRRAATGSSSAIWAVTASLSGASGFKRR
ncbi:MAG: hypothetical protein QOK44_5363, partial [Betaproteobacteria bacterium]|nr:hypothetical protein [Betaproteobacteria bacterium]